MCLPNFHQLWDTTVGDRIGAVSLTVREEAEQSMQEAIATHVRGLIEDGIPVPEPQSIAEC